MRNAACSRIRRNVTVLPHSMVGAPFFSTSNRLQIGYFRLQPCNVKDLEAGGVDAGFHPPARYHGEFSALVTHRHLAGTQWPFWSLCLFCSYCLSDKGGGASIGEQVWP